MSRYWVSWWSGNYADEGCTAPPFVFHNSGYRDRPNSDDRDECSLCTLLDCETVNDEGVIQALVLKHFPDAHFRFIERKADDFTPGDRFPDSKPYRVTA